MDLVTGARRVVVAMQHTAKGRSKVVRECSLPLTSARPIDLLVTELAVVAFPSGRATLVETADGVTVEEVLAATEAELVVAPGLATKAAVTRPTLSAMEA
jgi:acetate CoA/acetoacetate CoA-transferase beta subunit